MIETPDALRHVRHFTDGVCPYCTRTGRVCHCPKCGLTSCGGELLRVAIAADDEPCPGWADFDGPCPGAVNTDKD